MGLPRRLLSCFKPPSLAQQAHKQGDQQQQQQRPQQQDKAGTPAAMLPHPVLANMALPQQGVSATPNTPLQQGKRDLPPVVPGRAYAGLPQLLHEQDCCPVSTCAMQDQDVCWKTARRILDFNQAPSTCPLGTAAVPMPAPGQPDVLHSIVAALQPIRAPNPEQFRRTTTDPTFLDSHMHWDADCAAYMTCNSVMPPADHAALSCPNLARSCSVPEPGTPMAATAATHRDLLDDQLYPCPLEYNATPMLPPPAPRHTAPTDTAPLWLQPPPHNTWASVALQQTVMLLEPAPTGALYGAHQRVVEADMARDLAAGLPLTPVRSTMSPSTPRYALDEDILGTWGSDVGTP